MKQFLPAILVLVLATVANACNVPVFRYALERWSPDLCDVIVFHDDQLTDPQQTFVKQLEAAAVARGGPANVKVVVQDVDADMDEAIGLLWDELHKQPDVALPYVVVQSTIGSGLTINNWHGSVDTAMKVGLLSSPVRNALSKRLLTGDSAVWLVMKSNDEDSNNTAIQLLKDQLKVLSDKIPLPEGIGLPGSELFSDIPLLMKFSVLELDATDPKEQFLVELLKGFEPDAINDGEPLIVPIFGRGRVLEVIPASQVDEGLIEDLTLFLCGACSCQVKERNPGFDLLLSTSWEKELFGDSAEEIAPRFASTADTTAEPELVEIPAGKPVERIVDVDDAESQVSKEEVSYSLSWIVVCLVIVVFAIVIARSLKT